MPLDDMDSFGEFLEHLIRGWRYLFSRPYRRKKNQEWRKNWLTALFEIPVALLIVGLSVALLGAAVWALWSGLRL